MATWLGLPIEARIATLVLLGLVLGAIANHIVYRYAYFNPRLISPWGPAPESAPARKIGDRIPVLGWLGLRRENEIHGQGFWVRPLLIEIAMAISMPLLYHFETLTGGLLPSLLRSPEVLAVFEPHGTAIFFAHAILLGLIVAASFIDFDERIIPDIITIPGTLIGLVAASTSLMVFMPTTLPVNIGEMDGPPTGIMPTAYDSPWFTRPLAIHSSKHLLIGLTIWTTWIFALADRRISPILFRRRGLKRAIKHFIDGLFHYGFWKVLAILWAIGVIGILWIFRGGGNSWYGLFSSLIGLAVGGGIVWAIRTVASTAMGMEAMGFGDVTLMAMIGSFIGWQASLCAFFLAPFAAILIVITQWIITRDHRTPFGPYLSAGTLLTILYWDRVFQDSVAANLLLLGPMLLWIGIAMLGLMGLLLLASRWVKWWLWGER